ncbi:protein FAR1-RELATED SEQUENCE 5-like [Silene latifolia]|uniref:protein FAR1-RELATED SEQUENCE 5-like n=1 Tax=Silene latifolia TaxID=37657 RepID=UPI003D776FBD
MTFLVQWGRDSRSSSNVITNDITNERQMVEVIASQSISEISALNIDVPEIVQDGVVDEAEVIEEAEVIKDAEEEEEASGSSNMNRIFGCSTHVKPIIGMVFDTLELGIAFYEAYGKEWVDHHKRCVTFGVGLLINESKESFAWLFTRFLEAMGGRYPVCIITDEDLGLEGGLKKVFKDKVQHRYCMWHILKKLSEKVGPVICRETEFLKEINSCVWGEDVEPAEFDERWTTIVEAHGLSDNEWLQEKYGIRQFWIPAYFRDLFLGGLMRTTSRSESENHFFSNFTNPNLTLVEFWMLFESAMDTQRWAQSKLIAQSKYSFPNLATPLDLEKHAAETYTPRIFEEFKVEIKAACFTCAIGDKEKDKNHAILYIDVKDRERKKDYKVGYKTAEVKLVCNCKKFERHGILCRHILRVLKDYGFEKIPSEYLLNRWSKLVTCQPIFNSDGQLLADCRSVDAQKNKLTELWSEMFTCVSLVEQSPVNCDELLTILRGFKEMVLAETTSSVANDGGNSSIGKKRDKNAEIGILLGTSVPSEITILPPRQCKNKGSGKRMISQRERAGEVNKKPLRRCKACGQMANHDSRNCDRPKDH